MPKKGVWVEKERKTKEDKAFQKDIDNSIKDFEIEETAREKEEKIKQQEDQKERLRLKQIKDKSRK